MHKVYLRMGMYNGKVQRRTDYDGRPRVLSVFGPPESTL